MPRPRKHVFVCSQSRPPGHPRGSCSSNGGTELLQASWHELQKRNLYEVVAITYSGCIGPCDSGPNVLVYPEGTLYSKVSPTDIGEIFDSHLLGDQPVERLLAPREIWN